MISTDSQLDFTGQDIYVGLDIGKKSWKTCILTKDLEHKTFTQPPNVEALVGYLHRQFPGARYLSVYEAGYFGFWIHDELQRRGLTIWWSIRRMCPPRTRRRRTETTGWMPASWLGIAETET